MANFLSMTFKESAKAIKNLYEGWSYFRNHELVVGVTDETNAGRNGGVTNAQLLYIHEKGSPAKHIPPRPVIGPAMAQPQVKAAMKSLMRQAAFEALVKGNKDGCEQNWEKAGMIGRDACKKYISDGTNLAPNAPATIARKGSSTPLIDTGSLLNSISYAVRKK